MAGLKLIALDSEDLAVLSVHLQDAVVAVGDMTFLPKERRFVLLANRFDWEKAIQAEAMADIDAPVGVAAAAAGPCVRRRAGLRFERVLSARVRGLDLKQKTGVLNLLALTFEETNSPSGVVTFLFSGGSEVQLDVECMEAGLEDLGPAWDAKGTPCHEA
ncbi:DUF2948 family protein [Ancylobacter dichloromethanicus]|uniref:DUF2948 family protein n=1 Tax=Ancylobacter dichloromethanicus TaxID=518825 RepID=A0A9W6JDG8_9HYPH|nr:DUF2948 family protein [Ancylobacter dichloromethanicus]MBS7556730.1 DUF2948 family protein [Ancylobacter dichloromethanicus]GLK73583.1 hypothetical protein GCM10017643_37000 [Ancylobacter dichloromethanicus]